MNDSMRLTHNSLSTIIAWISTCLLFSGISTLFSESARMVWMTWGSFGLASAVGLDVVAQVRERKRMAALKRVAVNRFERDVNLESEANKTHLAIREAVGIALGGISPAFQKIEGRRGQERYVCNLTAEIVLEGDTNRDLLGRGQRGRIGRVTNLSDLGFELTLADPLPLQRIKLVIMSANADRITMLGEVLWCQPELAGVVLAGGRFQDVVSIERP